MFKRLTSDSPTITVTVNGTAVEVPEGQSVAAVLLVNDDTPYRTTAVTGASRAPYCMMGVCYDCLVEIDGVPNQQGCRIIAVDGMVIRRQSGAHEVTP